MLYWRRASLSFKKGVYNDEEGHVLEGIKALS